MIDLKKLRIEKGYTQEQLAKACGVVRQTISNIECGINNPSVPLAKALADILDVDWSEFFRE